MNKTAVITGASSGIGFFTAELFAKKGFKVYDLSRSGKDTDSVKHIFCDVTDPKSVSDAFDKIEGDIDTLILNAGYGISGAIEFTDIAEAKRQFDVNFFGALLCAQAVLPRMRKQNYGNIIFVSSVAAIFSIPFQSFYSASKAAINSLTCALKQEVKPFNIKVSSIMPGDTKTSFTTNRNKNQKGANVYKSLNNSVTAMEKDEQTGVSAQKVAKVIFKQAQKKRPKVLMTVGAKYKLFVLLSKLLPSNFANNVVGGMYCKK